MAAAAQDPVLGPPVMEQLRAIIRGCPESMMVAQGGHFVQEHGEAIARAALEAFGPEPPAAAPGCDPLQPLRALRAWVSAHR